MALKTLPEMTELAELPADNDIFVVQDMSDVTDGANGTTKKVTAVHVRAGLATSTELSAEAAAREAHEAAANPHSGSASTYDLAAALIASMPGHYSRDSAWAAKTVSAAADRLTLLSPARMAIDVGGVLLTLSEQQTFVLSDSSAWDSTATDYTVAANRAGKDFYVYACLDSGSIKLVVSANSTYPTGYTASTSRKAGGFHCLCLAVGTISGHSLSDYVAGDILPASVWDLKHRPVSSPEGMVYVSGIGKWVDIYLASVSSGALVSVNGGTTADGGSSPAFHYYKFSQWFGQVGKRPLSQHEFVSASLGSNQGTNISGSADPGTTGGHSDTAGRRMISNCGCEDCCGALWQWLCEAGGPYAAASWVDAYNANDSGVAGKSYYAPNRGIAGGYWNSGSYCGSRSSLWIYGPLYLDTAIGARGVAEPLAVAL